MKYLHSLTIAGLLVPFLSLTAEMPPEIVQATVQEKEEAALTSLDEELSLLDEEFEEFQEELYSLENDLKAQEKASHSLMDSLLKAKEVAALEIVEQSVPVMPIEPVKEEVKPVEAAALPIAEAAPLQVVAEPAAPVLVVAPVEEAAPPVLEKVQAPLPVIRDESPASMSIQGTAVAGEHVDNDAPIVVDLKQAFEASPVIYSILFGMSVIAVGIWLYALMSLRSSASVSRTLVGNLQNKLNSNSFDDALTLCQANDTLFNKMLTSGIQNRRHGLPVMIEAMKAEGKRVSISFWQKIGLLNDIAIIAPMLGLLGTVLGMFYAFYDVNRSIESVSTLFDGLGVSVGTTVAGLIVAILALILHSTAKYRLIRALAHVENEAQALATLIDDRTSIKG